MPIRKKLVSAENSEKFSRHFLKRKNCFHCFFYCWRRQNRKLLSNKCRWFQSKRSDSFFERLKLNKNSFPLSLLYGPDLGKQEMKLYCIWDTLLERNSFFNLKNQHCHWDKPVLYFCSSLGSMKRKAQVKIIAFMTINYVCVSQEMY